MSQSVSAMSGVGVRQTRYRWCVLALIFIIYTIASADRANIGITLPYIQKEFGPSRPASTVRSMPNLSTHAADRRRR